MNEKSRMLRDTETIFNIRLERADGQNSHQFENKQDKYDDKYERDEPSQSLELSVQEVGLAVGRS